jgi:phage terminase large subunit-like protein
MPAAESALSTTALATLAERFRVSVDDLAAAIETDPELAGYAADQVASFYGFQPRPDRPELFDQQTSYVEANDVVSFFVAGNGSGKTSASAYKCAQFLLHKQPPPRKDTPFWVITNTMQVAGEVLWKEKLLGDGHLPGCEIDWSRVSWANKKANHPSMVPLLPWPEERGGKPDCNWQIEFKSFEMGRQSLQSASIGGFWFSEQFPVGLFTETMVRCRDYLFPGGQFAEFTPLEPDLCVWLEQLLEEVPPGWGFYRGNTECNRENLAPNAIEAFMATVPDELIGTRLRGDLATFEGAIYPGFNVAVHVVPDDLLRKIPSGCWHAMGTDWGSSSSIRTSRSLAASTPSATGGFMTNTGTAPRPKRRSNGRRTSSPSAERGAGRSPAAVPRGGSY